MNFRRNEAARRCFVSSFFVQKIEKIKSTGFAGPIPKTEFLEYNLPDG